MKVLKRVIVASVILVICTGAYATPFTPAVAGDVYGVAQGGAVNGIPTARDNNDGIPDINDAINLVQGSALLRNKDADPLFVEPDYVWKQLDGTIVLIGLTAGNLNTIGYYTDLGTGAVQTPLLGPFSGFGFAGPPFPATTIGLGTGTLFGFYLNTVAGASSTDYFSEPGLNPGGWDHMMTFDLPGANGTTISVDMGAGAVDLTLNDPYLIAWEDLPFGGGALGDDDFDDMMYLVDKIAPIPEPLTILAVFGGIAAVGGYLRKRRHSPA